MNTSIEYDFLSGTGFDVHAVEKHASQSIIVCGVLIPCDYTVIAHSDGDVGLHALVDAILGAIGSGDIGEHFPPTDLRWQNANSAEFVTHALQLCDAKKAILVNVDITLLCEIPKILPYKSLMKKRLSELLTLPEDRINIKATTTEKLGFLGRVEGIAAQAIATVKIPVK